MDTASSQAISDYKLFLYMQLHESDEYEAMGLNVEGVKKVNFVGDAFPMKTVAFAKVEVTSRDTRTAWFREERKDPTHAEMALLKMPDGPIAKYVELFEGGDQRCVVRIVIYQNYSPCNTCSPAITSVCKTKNWKIHFVFVALHNIIRPSCKYRNTTLDELNQQEQRQNQQERKCKHSYGGLPLQKSVSDPNIEGLYNLQESGVTIRTFTKEDWVTLRDHLSVLLEPFQNYLGFIDSELVNNCLAKLRQAEDEYMQRDLQDILDSERLQKLEKMSVSEQVGV